MQDELITKDDKDIDGIKTALVQLNYTVSEVAAMTAQTRDHVTAVVSRVDEVETDFRGLSRKVDREIAESKRQAEIIQKQLTEMQDETLTKAEFTKVTNIALWKLVGVLLGILGAFGALVLNRVFA